MSKQSWRGSTLLNPEPPVLVSCGGLEKPNLITIGWTGTICTQPSMVSISVRPERYSHHLIQESGQFATPPSISTMTPLHTGLTILAPNRPFSPLHTGNSASGVKQKAGAG